MAASARALHAHNLPLHEIAVASARPRYPQIDFTGIESLVFEPEAGFLFARRACEQVVARVIAEGGEYEQASARSPVRVDARAQSVRLSDGADVTADVFVFACGPWLGTLFPDVIGDLIRVTRQEVYYFATPPGDERFTADRMPVWLEFGERFVYGIPHSREPGAGNREPGGTGAREPTLAGPAVGFKVADDTLGPPIDATTDARVATDAGVRGMSGFVARRFPALAGAPLVHAEVCQYESTPDSNFIIDRHPRADNVWLVGGGSGHGFKMGPAIGERVAALVLGESAVDPAFALARFASPPAGGWKRKWS
jgi:glycine/D-amino acid oxidase-like deaminating enzyme